MTAPDECLYNSGLQLLRSIEIEGDSNLEYNRKEDPSFKES